MRDIVATLPGGTRSLRGPLRSARLFGVCILSGIVGGAVAGGIGSRVAMRVLALLNSEDNGIRTENGNIAGQITSQGTIDLFFFSALFIGGFGGLLYAITRRWVPGSGLWKGLAFGVFLFCLFGSVVLEGDNRDFSLFGPPALGVALFALLFPLYGVIVSALAERLDRYMPAIVTTPVGTVIGYLALLGLGSFGLFHTLANINTIL